MTNHVVGFECTSILLYIRDLTEPVAVDWANFWWSATAPGIDPVDKKRAQDAICIRIREALECAQLWPQEAYLSWDELGARITEHRLAVMAGV